MSPLAGLERLGNGCWLTEKQDAESPLTQREKLLLSQCNKMANGQIPEAFPGAQPTSLTSQKVEDYLLREPYLVCEKTDGERHLLFAYEGLVYLINRRCRFWLCPVQLPLPDGSGWHHNTLLDGELILDRFSEPPEVVGTPGEAVTPTTNGGQWMYLIYDAIAINGEDLTHRTLLHRLKRALTDIVGPKERLLSMETSSTKDICKLAVKDFYEVWQMGQVLALSKQLPHATDGLVFTPVLVPYVSGTCPSLLKWKPALLNTVDFKLDIVPGDGKRVHVKLGIGFVKQEKWLVKFSGLWLAKCGDLYKQLQENQDSFQSMIGECRWNPKAKTFIPAETMRYTLDGSWQDGGWVLERLRHDKTLPNDVRTVKRVVESIDDDLSFDRLEAKVLEAQQKGQLKNAAAAGEGELERVELTLPLNWATASDGGSNVKASKGRGKSFKNKDSARGSKGDAVRKDKGKAKGSKTDAMGKKQGKGGKGKRNSAKVDVTCASEGNQQQEQTSPEKAMGEPGAAMQSNSTHKAIQDDDDSRCERGTDEEPPVAGLRTLDQADPLSDAAAGRITHSQTSVADDTHISNDVSDTTLGNVAGPADAEDQKAKAAKDVVAKKSPSSGRGRHGGRGRTRPKALGADGKPHALDLQLTGRDLLKRHRELGSDANADKLQRRINDTELADLIGDLASGSPEG